MDIIAALSGAKTAFELARALQNGLAQNQIKTEEVPARLMELQQHILSMQATVHDLAEENRKLSVLLEEANRDADLKADMEYVQNGGFYVRKSEAEKGLIPYCPICWQKDGNTVPLDPQRTQGQFFCLVHRESFETEEYHNRPKQQQHPLRRSPNW